MSTGTASVSSSLMWGDKQYESFEGLTEFQDVCRYCYNFNSSCECIQQDNESGRMNYSRSYPGRNNNEMDAARLHTVQNPEDIESESSALVVYSPPSSSDRSRRSVDTEEYHLKARFRESVPSKESRAILTNVVILKQKANDDSVRKLEIQNRIQSGWLSETYNKMLVLKTGVLSPALSGDLSVKIYNKTDSEIIIAEGSPLGILQSQRYEYT